MRSAPEHANACDTLLREALFGPRGVNRDQTIGSH